MIVVCGEALIDLVPVPDRPGRYDARPGGSPANVAVALGRLGSDVALLARLSTDPFGRLLREHLIESHVDIATVTRAEEPSTLAVVSLDEAGTAEYAFYIDGAADGSWQPSDLPPTLATGAPLHVSGSLALAVPTMGATVQALLERELSTRVITFDPNVRPSLASDEADLRARLDRWLGLVDLVKVSADDLDWIAPGEPAAAVAARWRALGPTQVVVTRGSSGAVGFGPAGMIELPGRPVAVADTVGAGDAFMAGLLAALDAGGNLERHRLAGLDAASLEAAIDFAQAVAAATCQRVGA
ncbi:MAG: carbohydrate kinase, partial [Mycobacteriales bacterium]